MSSHGVPEVLMKKVDEYVDSLAPQIQPRITSELDLFQEKTLDNLEDQVIDAFRSLFSKDKSRDRSLNEGAPESYGGQSLPFADELAKLTRSFTNLADEAGDDLRDILDLTEGGADAGQTQSRGIGGGGSGGDGARGFLSAAINAVQDHLDDNSHGSSQKPQLDGLLGVLSATVTDTARNPEDKARTISPEIKERVGGILREQHAPLAEQFTRIALDHIKRWLRGNTSSRDLGDGVKGEIEDQVKGLVKGLGGLLGNKKQSDEGTSRGFGDGERSGEGESGGFSKVISDKLSTGLARVHRDVRLEFRKILGGIEKHLFELLPDSVQRPLEKILGGNPFDEQLDHGQADRGFGDDIKAKLVNKIRRLVRTVQETLRESILGLVNGGHRKLERESWVFVQTMVEQKVHKYLPKVQISVPDDIGDERVSVGAPRENVNLVPGQGHEQGEHGGRGQAYSRADGAAAEAGYHSSDASEQLRPHQDTYHQPNYAQQPQQDAGYQQNPPDYHPQHQQGYSQQNQEHRPEYRQEYQSGHQQYQPDYSQQNKPGCQQQDYNQQYQPHHGQQYQTPPPQEYQQPPYRPQQQSSQHYQSGQSDDYQQSGQYGQNPSY